MIRTSTFGRSLGSVLIVASALLVSAPAFAQDTTDDVLDDILGGPDETQPQSIAAERQSLLEEPKANTLPTPGPGKKRVIQTLQRKNFMKIGRYEAAPHAGFVTNDPFINRYLIGVGFAYHVTEIFAVEASGTFSPDLGEGDYKPVTEQIINENQVTPDISKIQFYASLNFQYSPIYGKVAWFGSSIINFDIFGTFGTGVVNTVDDLDALGQPDNPVAQATQSQLHPTLNFGGGLRVVFSEAFAVRLEGRGLSYIEVLESTTLEMKNNFTIVAGASFFFPGMD